MTEPNKDDSSKKPLSPSDIDALFEAEAEKSGYKTEPTRDSSVPAPRSEAPGQSIHGDQSNPPSHPQADPVQPNDPSKLPDSQEASASSTYELVNQPEATSDYAAGASDAPDSIQETKKITTEIKNDDETQPEIEPHSEPAKNGGTTPVETEALGSSGSGDDSGSGIASSTGDISHGDNGDGNDNGDNGDDGNGDDESDPGFKASHTALHCLALVARHHGVDVSADRLVHDYSLENEEPSLRRVLRIAKDTGFKARNVRLRWKRLQKMGEAFPAIARLENGNHVIMVGLRKHENEDGSVSEQIAIFDPLADKPDFIFLERKEFEKSWNGDSILLKRTYSMLDGKQPFSLRWFIPEVFKQRTAFFDVAIAALFIHMIGLVVPLFFQIVIDKVLVNYALATLQVLTVGIVAALAFDALLGYMRSYLLLHATSKIDIRVATRTFGHMLSLPMNYFEQITAGVLTKHMQQTSKIREFLTGQLFMTLLDSTALFIFLPILFFYSASLTMVVLVFSGFLAINIGLLLGPYRRRLEALYNAEGERQAMLVETIHGVQTVKALSMEPVQRKNWDQSSSKAVAMHFRVGKISIFATTISKFLEKLLTVMIIWYGANMVFNRTLSVGELVAFQMIAGRVTGPLVQLVSLVHSYQEAALSVRMLGSVMNHSSEAGIGQGLRPPVKGNIEFDNVTFNYIPTSPPALNQCSIKFPAGKIVGVVGRSGSGKTTLTRMIQGMYSPQSGIIRFDGLDIRELDLAHLRQNIGVVLQDNFLFRGSVRENIAKAKPNCSFQEVVYVAKMAGAAEFVERLPQSYDTMLEENASNLSGGQKQRLAIARALLKDPRILIFDEATSALDPESEGIIQKNLKHIAVGRTVIIVSHRLSTLTGCDAIVVLDQGKVEMIGTHQQLLQNCKVYRDLWQTQMGLA